MGRDGDATRASEVSAAAEPSLAPASSRASSRRPSRRGAILLRVAGALAIGAPAAWVGAWYPPFGVPAMAILGAALGASLGHVAGKRGWAPPQTGIAFHAVVLVCGLLVTVGPLVIAALADPSSGGVLTVAFIGGAVLALIVVTLSLAVGAVMAIAAAVAARV